MFLIVREVIFYAGKTHNRRFWGVFRRGPRLFWPPNYPERSKSTSPHKMNSEPPAKSQTMHENRYVRKIGMNLQCVGHRYIETLFNYFFLFRVRFIIEQNSYLVIRDLSHKCHTVSDSELHLGSWIFKKMKNKAFLNLIQLMFLARLPVARYRKFARNR